MLTRLADETSNRANLCPEREANGSKLCIQGNVISSPTLTKTDYGAAQDACGVTVPISKPARPLLIVSGS